MPKRLTVIGATGTQGSSVVEAALHAQEEWKIRAITRNPSSEAAQALRAKGVEVVVADLEDIGSLKTAFAESHGVFAVTDFFCPFADFGADSERAKEIEWKQTLNIIEAASACTTLEHFVWSTLPHAAKISNGKYHIPHFEAKNRAEDYIKARPTLWAKTSFLWVAWYGSNFKYPIFKPTLLDSAGMYVQLAPVSADVPISSIGNPRANIGKFVLATLQQPEKSLPGRYILAAVEQTSMGKLLDDWSEVTGEKAVYVQTSIEAFDSLWPGWGLVEGMMLQFYDEFRKAWSSEDEILAACDLGVQTEKMEGVKETIRRMHL